MWRRGLLVGLVTALVVAVATPAAAAPELQLSPAAGAAGETFTVTGTGFAAADVEIHWGGASGELLTTATGPDFSVEASVPDVAPNSYSVVALVRDGGSISSSNASFQVTPGVETRSTTPVRDAPAAPSRGGGVDGGLPDTTNGSDPDGPTVDTVPSTTPATTAPAVTAAAGVTTTLTPATEATVPAAAAAGAATTAAAERSTSTVAGGGPAAPAGDERGAGALRPASTSRSSRAIQSPGLLVAGLGLVLAGAVALLVRSRRAPGGNTLERGESV